MLYFPEHSNLHIFQRFSIVLKKEEPRAGKRKPIEDSEDEDDSKKNDTTQNNPDLSSASQANNGQDGNPQAAVAQTQEKEKVVRANNTQAITSLLTTFNISL